MVEVSLEVDKEYPTALLVTFCVVTTLLVVVHLISLMISTCLLPNMEVYREYRDYSIYGSPDSSFKKHIEVAWILSTGIGLVLMMMDIGLLIGIKFFPFAAFTWVMTSGGIIVVPATIGFIYFAAKYYQKLLLSHFGKQKHELERNAEMVTEMDDVRSVGGGDGGHRLLIPSQSVLTEHGMNVRYAQPPESMDVPRRMDRFSQSTVESRKEDNNGNLIETGSGGRLSSSSIQDFQDCINTP